MKKNQKLNANARAWIEDSQNKIKYRNMMYISYYQKLFNPDLYA